MTTTVLTGIYTLTPTHCGTGQTSGAVDLPIAREGHTGLPVLPASGLKGAARHSFIYGRNGKPRDNAATKDDARRLFGPELEGNESLRAGDLVLLEGRLLLFPLRSLQRPYLYATCPLILERLARDLRALELSTPFTDWKRSRLSEGALVSDPGIAHKPLVVEDLVYSADEVSSWSADPLAEFLQALLPAAESATHQRLAESLVLLPDSEFADVVQRAVPVQARTRLTNNKTTGKDEEGNKGNLWYEEVLPSDCLFSVLVTERSVHRSDHPSANAVETFREHLNSQSAIQIGGNETVGQGLCWWTAASDAAYTEEANRG